MSTELVRKFRKQIPEVHRDSLDTRLQWLWHQKFGTVQTIWKESRDVLDHTACTIFLQAIMARDLNSIELLFQRLEGGAVNDVEIQDEAEFRF